MANVVLNSQSVHQFVWNEVIKIWFVQFKSETQSLEITRDKTGVNQSLSFESCSAIDSGSCVLWKGKTLLTYFSQSNDQSFQCKQIYKISMRHRNGFRAKNISLMFIGKTYLVCHPNHVLSAIRLN